jgi:hypothetical protein
MKRDFPAFVCVRVEENFNFHFSCRHFSRGPKIFGGLERFSGVSDVPRSKTCFRSIRLAANHCGSILRWSNSKMKRKKLRCKSDESEESKTENSDK